MMLIVERSGFCYFYVIGTLLIVYDFRYGDDWDIYTQKVPYCIFPYSKCKFIFSINHKLIQ